VSDLHFGQTGVTICGLDLLVDLTGCLPENRAAVMAMAQDMLRELVAHEEERRKASLLQRLEAKRQEFGL
jgi:hypothetical protein